MAANYRFYSFRRATIGSTPAIAAAVEDALGEAYIEMPFSPEKLWKIIHQKHR